MGLNNLLETHFLSANIPPQKVDYINVHGTSTPIGDIIEIKATERVFGSHIHNVNISSTKSMTGHLLGASGAVELIACIMAIQENVVPPTINQFDIDKDIDPKN